MRSQRRISCRDLGQGECNGWLWKKKTGNNSALSPRWTKRWVVLKEGALYCYRTEDGEKAESYIKLAGYQVMPAPENKRKFAFRVVHPQRKTFYFASDRQSDMSRWMNKMGLNAIEFVFPSDVGKKEIGGSNGDDQYYSESESEDAFYPSGVSSDQPLRSSGQVVALSMSSSSQNKATNLEQVHPSNEPIVDEPRSRDPPQRFVSNQSALNKIGKGGETSDFSDSLKDTPNSSPGTVPVASPRKKPAVSACQRDVHQAQPSQSLQVEGIGSHGADLQHSRSAEHSEHLKTTFSKADECEFRFSSDSEGNTRPKREIAVLLDTAKAAAQPWKVDSSIDDLCKALQDAEVDIHGVKRRVTLKRKMTILSRDPKKNELMLRKRAIQRQLKALQLEVEYFDSLLDQENISSKDLHAWINEHLSLVADLGTIRRISGRKPDDFQEHNSEGDTLLPSINSLPSTSVQLPTHLTFNDEQFSVTRSAPTVRTLPRAMTEERSSYQPLSGIGGDATTDKGAGPASNTSTPHRPRSSAFSSGESLPSRPLSEADSLRCRPAMQEKVHSQQLLRKQYLETDL